MVTPQTNESPNFLILILMVLLLKVLFDFKSMGGFNYPLLIKILYMIIIISAVVVILHPEEMKKSVRQTKIEDYFKKYSELYKKHENGIKIKKFLKIKLKGMSIREHMGIEDKDDAWACKSIDTKLDDSGDNNIFFEKVKN